MLVVISDLLPCVRACKPFAHMLGCEAAWNCLLNDSNCCVLVMRVAR